MKLGRRKIFGTTWGKVKAILKCIADKGGTPEEHPAGAIPDEKKGEYYTEVEQSAIPEEETETRKGDIPDDEHHTIPGGETECRKGEIPNDEPHTIPGGETESRKGEIPNVEPHTIPEEKQDEGETLYCFAKNRNMNESY